MQHAPRVRFFERAGDLDGETEGLSRRQRWGQRTPVNEFHHQKVGANIVDLTNVRMVERGDRARFPIKALRIQGRQTFDCDEPG